VRHLLEEPKDRIVGNGRRWGSRTDHQECAQDGNELLHSVSPLKDSLVGCEGGTAAKDAYSKKTKIFSLGCPA
jgi:hypothetical protein